MMNDNLFAGTVWLGHWLWMVALAVLLIIPFWRICQRLGWPGVLSFLYVSP
jgi:hypothetical protein